MRYDTNLFSQVQDALRRAARNLEGLKMLRPDDNQYVARLIKELRSAIPQYDTREPETLMVEP